MWLVKHLSICRHSKSHSIAHYSPLCSRWLKVQSLLKDYHENLQLALEVSSFYQQADNIMCAINSMVIQAVGYVLDSTDCESILHAWN